MTEAERPDCDNDVGRACADLWPTDAASWCPGCLLFAYRALEAERDHLRSLLRSLSQELLEPEQMAAYAAEPALIVQAAKNVNANEAHYRREAYRLSVERETQHAAKQTAEVERDLAREVADSRAALLEMVASAARQAEAERDRALAWIVRWKQSFGEDATMESVADLVKTC